MYDRFYRALYRIRRVEEEIARIYPTDKVKSPVHLSIGQEWVAVGVCEALRHDDVVFGSYRSHAMYLAKGGDLKQMIAELYGKATGCAKGKGLAQGVIINQEGEPAHDKAKREKQAHIHAEECKMVPLAKLRHLLPCRAGSPCNVQAAEEG